MKKRMIVIFLLLLLAGMTQAGAQEEGTVSGEAVQKAAFSCPMHPEVLQDEAGECPVCGMKLEPVVQEEEDEPAQEAV